EGTDSSKLVSAIRAANRPVELLRIQEAGGTEASIRQGSELVRRMLQELDQTPRRPMTMADLVVGTECGGSHATSGIAAQPAVGHFFDMLVDAGGTAIIEETLEALGCAEIASRRGATPQISAQITQAIEKAEAFSKSVNQFSIAPGNRTGG